MAQKSHIIETAFGEVMLKQCFDVDTQRTFCECYIGDNYDDYVGEIEGNVYEEDECLCRKVEAIL